MQSSSIGNFSWAKTRSQLSAYQGRWRSRNPHIVRPWLLWSCGTFPPVRGRKDTHAFPCCPHNLLQPTGGLLTFTASSSSPSSSSSSSSSSSHRLHPLQYIRFSTEKPAQTNLLNTPVCLFPVMTVTQKIVSKHFKTSGWRLSFGLQSWPWQWTPEEVDEHMGYCLRRKSRSASRLDRFCSLKPWKPEFRTLQTLQLRMAYLKPSNSYHLVVCLAISFNASCIWWVEAEEMGLAPSTYQHISVDRPSGPVNRRVGFVPYLRPFPVDTALLCCKV